MDKIVTFEQFMKFSGILFLAVGLFLLISPSWLWYILGVKTISAGANFLVRAQTPWAVSMGVLGVILRERDVSEPEARSYLIAFLVGCGLTSLLAVYGSLRGILNGFGWFAAVIFLALGLGSAYFLREGDA